MPVSNWLKSLLFLAGTGLSTSVMGASGEVTLIHLGDLHGHLVPRANVAEGGSGKLGGLARMYTKIEEIRARKPNNLLINTGDTIQGSAEVLFTRGKAIIDVLNEFKFDAFAPGNWDYVYGSKHFVQTFAGEKPTAPWNAIAANLYYVSKEEDPYTFFPKKAGQHVLPPYLIKNVNGLKVGILGFTSDRGPQTVGRMVGKGLVFSTGEAELARYIAILRKQEKVDLLVVASELGLANNIRMAEEYPGIDIVLSADMHEATRKPVVTKHGTVLVEEGQDGMMLGEINVQVENGRMKSWKWTAHAIDDSIRENRKIAQAVKNVRKTFVSGPDFVQHTNPLNGTRLLRPIDAVVGHTTKPLYRANYTNNVVPAAVEGTSHNFLTDAFRVMAGADVGAIRGFRYGTQVAAGPIRMADLYHFIPIGPQIGVVRIQGRYLKRQLENTANGSFDPNTSAWGGGWLFGFSGLTFDFDPYQPRGFRFSNIRVNGKPLDPEAAYEYAGYWFSNDANMVNGCECPRLPGTFIRVVKNDNGEPLDATEVVARYLATLPNKTVTPETNRVRLVKPLPKSLYGFPELQPLRGARPD